MQVEDFASVTKEGLIVRIYAQPGASCTELAGLREEASGGKTVRRLKVRLKARPIEGAANQALIGFFAELLNCPKSSITLKNGESSRAKALLIAGGDQNLFLLLQNKI